MAIVNLTATKRSNMSSVTGAQQAAQPGMNLYESTVEVGSADSATSTYHMARLPSNARLSALSRMMHDDLATAGAPTIDIGTANNADSSVADDPDAINNGIDVAAGAGAQVPLFAEIADAGQYLWELAGNTSDPGGFIDIMFNLVDADVNAGGTMTASIIYVVE